MIRTLSEQDVDAGILEAVERVNDEQKSLLLQRVTHRFGDRLEGRRFAVWGLSFKPDTDDMREAPSLVVVAGLLERGAEVRVHDPEALDRARWHFGERVTYCEKNYDALEGADALLVLTEWKPYRTPNFGRMRDLLREPVIFDGRNLFDPERMRALGFEYLGIGRGKVERREVVAQG